MNKQEIAREMVRIAKELSGAVSEQERAVVVQAIDGVSDILASLDMLVDKMGTSKERDPSLELKKKEGTKAVLSAIESLKAAHKKLSGVFHLGYFSTKNR
jgi:hypothetical protein